MGVTPSQRFSRSRLCPICGGHSGQHRGVGTRCHGYLSDDGRFAHCTREEFADGVKFNSESKTFAHLLDGTCNCGRRHGGSAAPPSGSAANPRLLSDEQFANCTRPYPCDYTDAQGNILYRVGRWRRQNGAKSYACFHPSGGAWAAGLDGRPPVLYRLPKVIAALAEGAAIHLVEGEKKVHLLDRLNLTSTCNSGGAKKFTLANAETLREAKCVVVWADNDKPGVEHAEQTARLLHEAGIRDIRLPVLPGLKHGQGIDDLLMVRHDRAPEDVASELLAILDATSTWRPEGADADVCGDDRVVITLMSDVRAVPVEWLWRGRIPLGMLTILDGDPGLGKSSLALDIAARLTRGLDMPDDSPGPDASGVVILSAEDDPSRVIRPRLDAAGAVVERVAVVGIKDEHDVERSPVICPTDLRAVERAVQTVRAKLVVVDPLMAYLPGTVNANSDQDVRLALVGLSRMAERTGAAVLVIRHLNKSVGGSAIYRGGGSIGIIAAARSGMLLGKDPDDTTGTSRVLAMVKSNLAAPAPSMRLRLSAGPAGTAQRVVWMGTAPHSAESLLAVGTKADDPSAIEEAEEYLRGMLGAGPVPTSEVKRQSKESGISWMSLRRAADRLGVRRSHVGQPGGKGQHWVMRLPEDAASSPEPGELSNFAGDEHLREAEARKPKCDADEAEGARAVKEEHLREHDNPEPTADDTTREFDHEAAVRPCACGGRILNWERGPICTGCRTRCLSDANGVAGDAHA